MGVWQVFVFLPVAIIMAVYVVLRLYRHVFGWGSMEDGAAVGRAAHHVSSRNQWGFPTVNSPGKVVSSVGPKTKEPWGW